MDTKWKKVKNVLLIVICICISAFVYGTYNINDILYEYNEDFFKSGEFETMLQDRVVSSVYSVSDIKDEQKMGRRNLDSYKSMDVFVINNENKITYSNNNKYDSLKQFINMSKNNYYNLMLNLGDKTTQLTIDGKIEKYEPNGSWKSAVLRRKENVVIYISIPTVDKVKDMQSGIDGTDYLYNTYIKRYEKRIHNQKSLFITIMSTVLIGIICALTYMILCKKGKNEKTIETKSKITIEYNLFIIIVLLMILVLWNRNIGMAYDTQILILYSYISIRGLWIYSIVIFIKKLINIKKYKLKNNSIILNYLNISKNTKKYKLPIIKLVFLFTSITFLEVIMIYTVIGYTVKYTLGQTINYSNLTTIIWILGLMNLAICLVAIHKVVYLINLGVELEKVKEGSINSCIEINDDKILANLSKDINSLGETINIAIEDRLKSEKMKTELITNVSHDLKTPLTAMINYISLLKEEDLKPEHVKDYITVLDKRSQRLKVLIDDLFEASKINSGDIELNLQQTDINQLLMQSIVEMDDIIEDSQLDFIINTPKEEIYILADGRKTWRVFENLISNIIKYSLKGTRVYIDMTKKEHKVEITMKNISNHPLNFDPNEITERFTRGDLSRNTEGSGLGLAIAKGFIQSQGGKLDINILGDLFIVKLEFDLLYLSKT